VAGIHAAHDQQDDQDHAPDAGQSAEAIRPGDAADRRPELRIELEADQQHDDVAAGLQQAGQDAGEEKGTDRLLGDETVDHEQHRRRDHDGERAAGRDAAGRDLVVVAVLLELRQGDPAHHRRRCRGRAARRGEAGTTDYGGDGEAAGQMAEPLPCRTVDVARDVGVVGEEAHQDKERQHQQVVADEMAIHRLRGERGRRPVATQDPQAEEATHCGRKGDAHARYQ
jgi:hypothetical protein